MCFPSRPTIFSATTFILFALVDFHCSGAAVPIHEPSFQKPTSSANQLWLIDSRAAPSEHASVHHAGRLTYWHRGPTRWHTANLEQLLQTDDPDVITLIYVHENRVSRSESFQRADVVFSSLRQQVPDSCSFRMLAFSWPSDRIGILPRPDARIKARRSEAHGLYLAWVADKIQPDVPVGMFGMSYGARVITAALHHLGNGSIEGRRLPIAAPANRAPIRIVIAAAAIDADWLQPGQRHGCALSQVDNALVLFNPRDRVLKRYPRVFVRNRLFVGIRLSRRGGSQALGYAGPAAMQSCWGGSSRLTPCNVSDQVGGSHSWKDYAGSPAMMRRIVSHLVR